MASDELSNYYSALLDGSYDCVDRIVLNAHFGLAHSAGGFRTWWRGLHENSDDELDNAHLMRMAGRFSRRVRGWASANGVPVIDCGSEERKHKIAEEHLKKNPDVRGVFLVLVPWPPDPASACGAPFISEAAEVGHADGMSVLGTMYLFGRGVQADGVKAEAWLKRAARSGQVDAQSILGIMYATRQGVARNIPEAKEWLMRAAKAGDKHAIDMLRRIGGKIETIDVDVSRCPEETTLACLLHE